MEGINISNASDVYVGGTLAKYVYIGNKKVWDYKTTPVYTAPTAKSGLVYTGSALTLLNAGSTGHGIIYYSTDNSNWSTSLPTSVNANTNITVYWKLVGDGRHYDISSTAIVCSIAKANQSAPTATGASVSYGNTATATASGGGGQGSIEWSNGNTLSGSVNSKKTKARWSGNSNYNASAWSNEVTLAIVKANPTYTAPTAKTGLKYTGSSQTLYNAGSNTTPGNFTYTNGTRTNAGSQTVSWSFTPTDTTNYNSVNGSFKVTIAKAAGATGYSTRSLTYSRSAQTLGTVSGNTGTNHYRLGTSGSWSTSIPNATNAGSYNVYVYTDESTNYNAVGSSSSPVKYTSSIAKVTPVISGVTKTDDWTYNGSTKNLASGGSAKHSSTDSTAVAGSFSYSSATNAGSYSATYTFTPTDTTNYNSVSSNVGTVTVAKATGSTGCSTRSLTYSRGGQNLVAVSGNTGTNHYRYSYNNGSYSSWSTSVPSATNAGTYVVQVYTDTSTNYNAVGSSSSPSSYTTTIAKVTPVLSTSPSYRTGLTYNGSAQNLLSGGAMKHSSSDATAVSGTFTYDTGTDAGTYTNKKWYFTPSDTTNYNSTNGTITGSTTIAQASRTISFTSAPSTVIKGNTISVAASQSVGGGTITYSSGNTSRATVSGSTVTGVSKGTVTISATIAASGNYASATTSYTLTVVEWENANVWQNGLIWPE